MAILIFSRVLPAQNTYFQQEVNYKINATLNDNTHELHAFEEITYTNNSNTSLNYIYFHLWPNAYKNHKTALAKQLLENKETAFYFSKPEERGYIDSLHFKVNGQDVKIEYDETHIDICKVILNEPLKSSASLVITTPFHVKLPDAKFSRLGHTGQAYYITQWYPKPAVYDLSGWHPMPYLNQGEFYSEFGSFDVSITLPENYMLAATGDRIDAEEEEERLNKKVNETKRLIAENRLESRKSSFPPSSEKMKTIRFTQYNVHDFAWFADKRFHVLNDKIALKDSGKEVTTWLFFTDNEASLWKNALEYINDAVLFYSYFVGDYPYNHVTAIDGLIAAGGGMEYPNITIIGESNDANTLETTIVHEVGHNWFYGILGSNERDFPAMDEGLNSFYEMRYFDTKYPSRKLSAFIGRDSTSRIFGLNNFPYKHYYYLSYLLTAKKNTDQAINNKAVDFTEFNYGAIVYSKTAIVFDYLMNAFGSEKFDMGMRFYFDNWKYKHPSPADLQKTLEYYCNANLSWFIEGLIISKDKLDYKILKHKKLQDESHLLLVKNNGNVQGPVTVSGFKKGKVVGQVWYNGFEGKRVFEFPPSKVDYFKIDGFAIMPEVNKNNNIIRTKGIFKKTEPLQFNFLAKLDNPNRTQINYLPIAGYNAYNKFMLGFAFYNYSLLQKKFEYTLAPFYSFGSNTPVGFAEMRLNFTPDKIFQQISFGFKAKSFAFDAVNKQKQYPESKSNNPALFAFTYYKVEPFLKLDIKKQHPRSQISQSVFLRSSNIWSEEDFSYNVNYISAPNLQSPIKKIVSNFINEIRYELMNTRVINPFNFKLSFSQNTNFGKIAFTGNYYVTLKKQKQFEFRLFAGTFVYGNNESKGAYRFRASGFNGYHDYMYDYNFVGRNEYNGLGFAQFAEEDGAMKVWTPLGQSATWLTSLNVKSPQIFKLPIKLFADVVMADPSFLVKDKLLYNAGVDICLWKDIFEIYLPLFYSNDIKNTLKINNKGTFPETIRFTFNINKINPRQTLIGNF